MSSFMLSAERCEWVIETALRGKSRSEIVSALVRAGFPAESVARDVAALLDSPLFETTRVYAIRAQRAEAVLDLHSRLLAENGFTIERRKTPAAREFFSDYFAVNRPVVFTDFTEGWRARNWTPSRLAERLGETKVEVCMGRNGDPRADANIDAHRTEMPFRHYTEMIVAAGETNDMYCVASNANMKSAAFHPLLDDIVVDATFFDPSQLGIGTSLWIGPAGTVTSLHFDTTNVMFNQLHGKKKFTLASPLEKTLLLGATGYYSLFDPEDRTEDLDDVHFHTTILEPGETLFLPVGWWHHVRALDVSISLSLMNFQKPNAFHEYRPGNIV